jgi:hypothetical protein
MRARFALIAALLFLFISSLANFAFASTQVSVSDIPLTVDQSNDFEVSISFACSSCTSDSYLRGVFYPNGSSYFGYTRDNSGNWNNAAGGNCTSYYKILLSDLSREGTWSGKLKVKPDIENAFYNGPGEYLFKVGRYTPSCGSPTWSSESTISILGPTSTPTSAPTSTPMPTSTPTNSPTPTRTPTPTLKPSPSPTPKEVLPTNILGESTQNEETISPADEQPLKENNLILGKSENKSSNWFLKVSIFVGIVFLTVCAILIFLKMNKGELMENE